MLALVALILISLSIAVLFLIFFIKSVKNNQFSDTYTPAVRILFDDTQEKKKNNSKIEEK